MPEEWKNKLFFGDNLDVLRRYISDESVDLIYLDPPFNSKATYNVLFKEKNGTAAAAQIRAFDDFWHWDLSAEEAYREVVQGGGKIGDLLDALRRFLGSNDMMAYLTMMAIRLKELHRVLKPTGPSISIATRPPAITSSSSSTPSSAQRIFATKSSGSGRSPKLTPLAAFQAAMTRSLPTPSRRQPNLIRCEARTTRSTLTSSTAS